jgi:hypothetical protein
MTARAVLLGEGSGREAEVDRVVGARKQDQPRAENKGDVRTELNHEQMFGPFSFLLFLSNVSLRCHGCYHAYAISKVGV